MAGRITIGCMFFNYRSAVLVCFCVLAGCGLQTEPVRIDVSNLAVHSCNADQVRGLPPDERGKICYSISGTASNPSTQLLGNVNLYGVIFDAEGTVIKEGRIGSVSDLSSGKVVPFQVRVFFTQKVREPLKLDAFRAKGLSKG